MAKDAPAAARASRISAIVISRLAESKDLLGPGGHAHTPLREATIELRVRASERLWRNAKPVRNPINPVRARTGQIFAHRGHAARRPILALASPMLKEQATLFRAEAQSHESLDAKGPRDSSDSGSTLHLKSSHQGRHEPDHEARADE